ncbi:Serine incorporator 3 [Cichlidogyrus casuarinus]|uniref:Serine incorporator 3 n=1 Tax=Cichlidogyrus casuarinus TaxID=1844966 RepID=A0ABD2Q5G0_9PLAT
MGCMISSVACCFASTAASLCCSCLPSCKGSTSTRLMYTFILILTAVISIILLIPNLEKYLERIPYLCPTVNCSAMVGFAAVYRVNFASVIFYMLFCLLTIGVKSSSDIRGKINNGFWFFKFLIWIGLIIASFFIPSDFNYPWMIIGVIGGVIYLLIQLILLIDFAHSWSENWIEKHEDGSKIHAFGLVFFTIFLYLSSIVSVALFFVYYAGHPDCYLHKIFISINLILCVIISVVSILPVIHEHLPNSGLLQSSVISMYILYQTWSAMTNSPLKMCNPTLQNTQVVNTTNNVEAIALGFQWQIVVGLCILLISVAYAAFKSSSSTSAGKLALSVSI